MNRRILYYYVLAKFRSLFSFCSSQRAHNLLSTMRQATKLHCCSANRVVLVDGLTCCEVCLSTEAATEAFLGTPSPSRTRKKRKEKKGIGVEQQVAFLVLDFFSLSKAGKQLAGLRTLLSWKRCLCLLMCMFDSQHPLCSTSKWIIPVEE